MMEFFHLDLITLVVVVAGFLGTWYSLKADSKWHTEWIHKHTVECNEIRKANALLLVELQTSNMHLATVSEGQIRRLDRSDEEILRLRNQHDTLIAELNKLALGQQHKED